MSVEPTPVPQPRLRLAPDYPGLSVREIVGANHLSVMSEPHIGAVARQLEALLVR